MSLIVQRDCQTCNATGSIECGQCRGTGIGQSGPPDVSKCSTCWGRGTVGLCPDCEGRAQVDVDVIARLERWVENDDAAEGEDIHELVNVLIEVYRSTATTPTEDQLARLVNAQRSELAGMRTQIDDLTREGDEARELASAAQAIVDRLCVTRDQGAGMATVGYTEDGMVALQFHRPDWWVRFSQQEALALAATLRRKAIEAGAILSRKGDQADGRRP